MRRALVVAGAVLASLALGWFISMTLAYEEFTFVPGPLIVAGVLHRLRRRAGATPRTAAIDAALVVAASCLIAWGLVELADAFGDAVGEYEEGDD